MMQTAITKRLGKRFWMQIVYVLASLIVTIGPERYVEVSECSPKAQPVEIGHS
ncbi:unnamed protein product, partial [Gongylonema pulchrum]|uniref:DUF2547 family protein n=1 Tax=Gongylonema pulchrum TaxID=637853 RepID=A0A183F147_9BILA